MNDVEIKSNEGITDDIINTFKRLNLTIEFDEDVELIKRFISKKTPIYIKGLHGDVEFHEGGDIEIQIVRIHKDDSVVFKTVNTKKPYVFSLLSNSVIKHENLIYENMAFQHAEDRMEAFQHAEDRIENNHKSEDNLENGIAQCTKCENFFKLGKKCIFCKE